MMNFQRYLFKYQQLLTTKGEKIMSTYEKLIQHNKELVKENASLSLKLVKLYARIFELQEANNEQAGINIPSDFIGPCNDSKTQEQNQRGKTYQILLQDRER